MGGSPPERGAQGGEALGEVHGAGAQLHEAPHDQPRRRRRQRVALPPQRRLLQGKGGQRVNIWMRAIGSVA